MDNTSDIVYEANSSLLSGGNDTIEVNVNYVLSANLEKLALFGVENLSGTGNAQANTLIGNSGNNLLNSGAGADTLEGSTGNDSLDGGVGIDSMVGGVGDDVYVVDNIADKVVELGDEGTDTVKSSMTYALTNNIEKLILSGTALINGTGDDLDNVITGNVAANKWSGGAGADTLTGGLGNDTLDDGAGADTFKYMVMTESLVGQPHTM